MSSSAILYHYDAYVHDPVPALLSSNHDPLPPLDLRIERQEDAGGCSLSCSRIGGNNGKKKSDRFFARFSPISSEFFLLIPNNNERSSSDSAK